MNQKTPDPPEALAPTLSTGEGKSDCKDASDPTNAAEQAPTQSVRRYEHLVHAAKAFIFTVVIKDGQPACTVHYPGVLQVTGYGEQEYAAQPQLWLDMIYPEDRDVVLGQIAQLSRAETPPPIKHRLIHKDGSIRWVRNTSVPVLDSEGKAVGYDGLVVDISETEFAAVNQGHQIADLTSALAMVKRLQTLLPICASCKKIRDDQGYWQEVEAYFAGHYPALEFTHGLCPACLKKLYDVT